MMESRAVLKGYPVSERKMRLIANMIRNETVVEAMKILILSSKHASIPVLKTLKSAVSNFIQKYSQEGYTEDSLMIKKIFVDQGKMLKRVSPAPMGRAHRVRKRSNHLTVIVSLKEEILKNKE